jgi:uncharacterized protein
VDENLQKIHVFLQKHHTMSLATCKEDQSFTCTLFYAYDLINNSFIVASEEKTQHIQNILFNEKVSGSVHLETDVIGKIQGVQFLGRMQKTQEKKLYFQKFPYALAMNPTLWSIEVDFFKLTDNRLGFGKKIIWTREAV